MAQHHAHLWENAEPADYRDDLGVPIPAAEGPLDPSRHEQMLRLSAMAFAVETQPMRDRLVVTAEEILAFLKGGDPK